MERSPTAFIQAASTSLLVDAEPEEPEVDPILLSSRSTRSRRALQCGGLDGMRSDSGRRLINLPYHQFQGSVYYGWLWKRGASFKTWKKRFFLLHGCTLTYYTQCCVISTDQTGTRCLDLPAKGGLRVASAELSELTSFGVMVKSSSGRVLHLQAGDLDSRMQWVKVLQEAPEKKTTPPSTTRSAPDIRCTTGSDFNGSVYLASGSVDLTSFQSSLSTMSDDDSVEQSDVTDMRGWLNVRGSLFMGWKKRYVTLVDGHVTVLTRARKRKPQDKSSEVIGASSWSGRPNGLIIRLANHRDIHMYADSSDEAQRWLEALKSCL